MKKKNKKLMIYGIIGLLLVFSSLFYIANIFKIEEQYTINFEYGAIDFKIINPFFYLKPLSAIVDDDVITLGDEICWVEMTDASWMGGCIERVEWEIYKDSTKVKTVGKDLTSPKCGTLTYSQCWEPNKVGNYQITSYFILDNGDITAESSDKSFFVVEEGQTCEDNSYKKCYNNNLYWYDSCGDRGNLAETCSNGCENDQCKTAPILDCNPGQENCNGYALNVCSSLGKWENKGVNLNKCEVQCIEDSDCEEGTCGDDYKCQKNNTEVIVAFIVIISLIVGVIFIIKSKKIKRFRR